MEQKWLTLKLLSPLWVGGIEGSTTVAREIGLLGSLRWWYEAILRSLGYRTCDPTSRDGQCSFNHEAYHKSSADNEVGRLTDAGLCPACQVYGATGFSRAFRLEVSGGTLCFDDHRPIPLKPSGRTRGWFLGSGLVGDLTMTIIPLRSGFDKMAVLLPLAIAARWGGLGARTQLGYGVVHVPDESLFYVGELDAWCDGLPQGTNGDFQVLPDLRDFFFTKLQFTVTPGDHGDWWKEVDGIKNTLTNDNRIQEWSRSGSVPIAPALKNWMRFGGVSGCSAIAGVTTQGVPDFVYGKSHGRERQRSHIHISCAYHPSNDIQSLWEFRLWGWLPEGVAPGVFKREDFLDDLKQKLEAHEVPWQSILGQKVQAVQLKKWREFNSPRDSYKQIDDAYRFLKSLLWET